MKMVEIKEKNIMEVNPYIFNRISSHNPPTSNDVPKPKEFEWLRGIKKLSDNL